MGRVEKTIEIKAPPEKVWEMLVFARIPEWDEGTQKNVKRVEYISEVNIPADKFKVGATANFLGKNDKLLFPCEITESIENEKIAYYLSYSFVKRIDISYVLKPIEKGTKLLYVSDYEMPWGILGKFLDKLMVGSGKEIERSLENLKSILEK